MRQRGGGGISPLSSRPSRLQVEGKFYLDMPLPYEVNDTNGSAKFDKASCEAASLLAFAACNTSFYMIAETKL